MGVEVEFVPTEWSGIIPALLTGKFDVIIGGMGVTAERALKVNFSAPYEWSGIDVVVNKNMLPGLTNLDALNSEDVVIAVRLGATPVEAARRHAPKAQLRQFDTDEAVIAGSHHHAETVAVGHVARDARGADRRAVPHQHNVVLTHGWQKLRGS